MKIKDIIEFYSDFFQDFNKEKMCGLLKFMKLEENMMINSLSKGMCEKLNLSLTLLCYSILISLLTLVILHLIPSLYLLTVTGNVMVIHS